MGQTLRTIVFVGYVLVLATLAIDAGLVYSSVLTIAQSYRQVDQTRQVIVALERILSALKDAETGQRGYILTGREDYLEPFRGAGPALETNLRRLRSLTTEDDVPRTRIDDLAQLADAKMAELRRSVAIRREKDLDAALEVVLTDHGKDVMDRARRVVEEVEARLNGLLDERVAASQAAARNAITSFSITTATAVLLLVWVLSMHRRERAIRDQADEAVRRERAWLSTTLASIGDAVIATDPQGQVRFLNPIAQTLIGWTQAEAVGRPLEDVFQIINEQTRRPVIHPVDRVIREGVIVGLANHTILIARDGTETPIEDSAAPIKDDEGNVAGVVMVFRDVTKERRNQEERERLLAEANEANRAKDQFLAVLSHELRTPLNPILLATSAMLERPAPPEELRPNLEMIRQYVNLQSRLIDDLLDVMRIVRGKMPLHWEVADCKLLIERATEVCRSELLGKNLRLKLDLAAEHHHLNADPARLQQVFWNLLKNALKFSPAGGTITIRTRNQAGPDALSDRLIIEVSDTGIGIEPDAAALIFDPFQQGGASVTTRFGGLGLGLAISKGIVEGHGGLLTVESAGKDQGATFRIDLPSLPTPKVERDGRPAGSDPAAASTAPPRRKILLVEDEPATVRLLARLLQRLGHQVTTAMTIASALEAERAGDHDLIISDIGLPDGSGLELIRQVVARRGPIPAIALTGYGMEEDIQRSRSAGFSAHMTKPIDFTKLQSMIQQIAP
jgi:PAS domain S-box-containing protein